MRSDSARHKGWRTMKQQLHEGQYIYSDLFPLVASVYVTRKWASDPLWVIVVGPPGAGKTTTMLLFDRSPQVLTVADLTPASLVTAWGGPDKDPSLFAKIDQHMLVVTDFSSIMALGWEREHQILALMRQAFDGKVSKDFAMLRREYSLHFNFIGAATESYDSHAAAQQELGERFIRYRPPIIDVPFPPPTIHPDLPNRITEWVNWVTAQEQAAPVCEVPPHELYDLAELTALMRTEVAHDYRTHEITEIPKPERPTRLTKQLLKLYSGLAAVTGNHTMALQMTTKVARGTIPPRRIACFETILREPGLSTTDIAERLQIGYSVARYLVADMNALGLVEHAIGTQSRLCRWRLPKDLQSVFSGLFCRGD